VSFPAISIDASKVGVSARRTPRQPSQQAVMPGLGEPRAEEAAARPGSYHESSHDSVSSIQPACTAGTVTAAGTGTGASGRLARLTIGHRLGRLLAADDRGALMTAGAQCRMAAWPI
jgi:hypothetical protein